MSNFKKMHLSNLPREETKKTLGLTGCEISFNQLPAGVAVPFVHAHKQNEEVYVVTEGKGQLYIDGEVVDIEKGDVFRIDPAGKRAVRADEETPLSFFCIQTKKDSLEQFTMLDGVIVDDKAPWHEK